MLDNFGQVEINLPGIAMWSLAQMESTLARVSEVASSENALRTPAHTWYCMQQ